MGLPHGVGTLRAGDGSDRGQRIGWGPVPGVRACDLSDGRGRVQDCAASLVGRAAQREGGGLPCVLYRERPDINRAFAAEDAGTCASRLWLATGTRA